jgi:hypothetical protein
MSLILNGDTGISAVDGTASVPALVGNDTNTGIYFPAADTIGFSEGGVQVGEFDSSANFKFNSGYGSVATAYGCRAWVNFNGTGTPAIRASGNVTSITDNGTGDYTVNFTTALVDTNYAVATAGNDNNNVIVAIKSTNLDTDATLKTTSALTIVAGSAGTNADVNNINVVIFR